MNDQEKIDALFKNFRSQNISNEEVSRLNSDEFMSDLYIGLYMEYVTKYNYFSCLAEWMCNSKNGIDDDDYNDDKPVKWSTFSAAATTGCLLHDTFVLSDLYGKNGEVTIEEVTRRIDKLNHWTSRLVKIPRHCEAMSRIIEKSGGTHMQHEKRPSRILMPLVCDVEAIRKFTEWKGGRREGKRLKDMKFNADFKGEKKHWILAHIDIELHTIHIFDSLNIICIQNFWSEVLAQWTECKNFRENFGTRKKFKVFTTPTFVVHQENGTDCGYYTCLYAHMLMIDGLTANQIYFSGNISQDLMNRITRSKIREIIINKFGD